MQKQKLPKILHFLHQRTQVHILSLFLPILHKVARFDPNSGKSDTAAGAIESVKIKEKSHLCFWKFPATLQNKLTEDPVEN